MIHRFAALPLLLAAVAAPAQTPPPAAAPAPPSAPAGPVDRDALCFVITAVASRQIQQNIEQAPEQIRQLAPAMVGAANYHLGRISVRLAPAAMGPAVNAALRESERMRQSDISSVSRTALECMSEFQRYLGTVSTAVQG